VSYDAFIEQVTIEKTVGQPWKATFRLTAQSQSSTPGGGGGPEGPLLDSSGDDFVLDSGTAGVLG
jgi:hypothetical protein